MKTDEDIQKEVGLSWPIVKTWRDISVDTAVQDFRDTFADTVEKYQAIEAKLSDPEATLEDVKVEKDKTVKQRELKNLMVELENKKQQFEKEIDDLQARIDELEGK